MSTQINDLETRAHRFTPLALPGQCATLQSVDTHQILSLLGTGTPFDPVVRQDMETQFRTDFGNVFVHTDTVADRLAEHFGAEAFAIGNHITFRTGRYQPNSSIGRELLRHELAHTLGMSEPRDSLQAWLTLRNNRGTHRYLLPPEADIPPDITQVITVEPGWPTSHETMTEHAARYIGGYGAGLGVLDLLKDWSAQPDNYKEGRFNFLKNRFNELGRFTVDQLHAYGGPSSGASPADIGLSSISVLEARLTGGGVAGALLDGAVRRFRAATKDNERFEALRLLGISLHTIQDFYAHKAWLGDRRGQDLRVLGRVGNTEEERRHNKDILEDDPNLDYRRWENARHRTAEQLRKFKEKLLVEDPRLIVVLQNLREAPR